MADSKNARAFRERKSKKSEYKKWKKEEGKKSFIKKLETAAKAGHLLRLEQRTRQTAQTSERQLSGASQTRANEDKARERNG